MAKAESRSITRRALVAGSAAAVAAFVPAGAEAAAEGKALAYDPKDDADPIYRAIDAHARAYAAYDAQQKAEPDDEVTLEPLVEAEWAAAAALAATVPTTLAGTAAALAYVHALHARDRYMLLDDWHCYVFIASAATALRRALDRAQA